MTGPLADKHIVLGVTGSIACYKAVDLASKLVQAGALVDVVMSYGATRFVTPLAFRSITHREVVTDIYDTGSEFANEHVALARRADIVVIAPATVHCIAKLAAGLADDPLTTTVIATQAPLLLAPAMDAAMYDHPAHPGKPGKAASKRSRHRRPGPRPVGLRSDRHGPSAGDSRAAGTHCRGAGTVRRPGRAHYHHQRGWHSGTD